MRVDGVPVEPALFVWLVLCKKELPKQTVRNAAKPQNSLAALDLLYLSATAALLRIGSPRA